MPNILSAETLQKIKILSAERFTTLQQIRRDLHQHPELSGKETWTANYIANQLRQLGLDVQTGIGGHGLVANLITNPSLPTVALRVDMDALPIQEQNRVSYRSKFPGVMHACGHDVHSAIGVGTASVLTEMAADLPGNVRFIFQPEEEEITGALRMIRDGVLSNPVPEAILGLHVAPIPTKQIAWSDGLFLAGFEHYLGILTPQDGHRTTPGHLDAVARRCCQVIRSFNQFTLPETWEEMQAFWQLMQEGPQDLRHFIVYDATPNEEDPVAWQGQFGVGIKAANLHLRHTAMGRIKTALNRITEVTHTNFRIVPMGAMMDMRNHKALVRSILPALEKALGAENLIHLKAAFPFNCEDFAFYTKKIPGMMLWLGAADPARGKYAMLHTPDFDVDEQSLETGTIAMSAGLFSALQRKPNTSNPQHPAMQNLPHFY